MPIVQIDVSDSRSAEERRAISDGVHRAFVDVVGIPDGDRFHIINVHPAQELLADPQFLGVKRKDVIFIQITLVRGRSDQTKRNFYRAITANLAEVRSVRPEDVSVVLRENERADYSWGNGEAQVLDGPPLAGVEASAGGTD